MVLVANSTPIVLLDSRLNSLRVKRERRLDFPTPESPISTILQAVRCHVRAYHAMPSGRPGWLRCPLPSGETAAWQQAVLHPGWSAARKSC